ncbi:MAG TPA: LysR substrate-binding domain-containing protein [Burkholderiales bacterium]|nr:LysR substrate-binding domain-containing protein [Burkholderiales bacterium]
MNLRQLLYLREVAGNGLSISKAARRLHTSQPGVSQQILALERELQLTIFVRDRNRLVDLTPQGKLVVARAESALLDIEQIRVLARSAALVDSGHFVIATTHTQARYVLPEVLSRFAEKYPKVRVTLQHGNAEQIAQALTSGAAHIGVTPSIDRNARDIVALECRRYPRIVLAPKDHTITRKRIRSLADVAKHPLVTFEPSISARRTVLDVFARAGLTPNVILSAIDTDVVKACVERGLGLAIVAEIEYDPARDVGVVPVKTPNLFPPSVTRVTIHRKRHLPLFAFDFVEMFAPAWTRARIEHLLAAKKR